MRHYVDGRLQPLPEKGGFLPLMGRLVSLRVGRDIDGGQELHGFLDEMRLSDVVRYPAEFTPPESFSLNHRAAYEPARPDGPPLLFGPDAPRVRSNSEAASTSSSTTPWSHGRRTSP